VDDRGRVAFCSLAGAVAGAAFGYLYLTEAGRRLRVEIEPRIDDFVNEVRRLRGTVEKAKSAADESWRSLNELVGEETGGERWRGGGGGGRMSH
jgi:hypothetical protein